MVQNLPNGEGGHATYIQGTRCVQAEGTRVRMGHGHDRGIWQIPEWGKMPYRTKVPIQRRVRTTADCTQEWRMGSSG